MASEYWPTYVLLSLYIVATIIVTIIANRKNRKSVNNIQENDESNSIVVTHFLASKAFGPFILLFTAFASIFSGYTIVGVPDEAATNGFSAVRWIAANAVAIASFLIFYPRIRRISIIRNYESPGDFINDRYNENKLLSCLVTLCLCITQLIVMAVDIYSLGTLLQGLTDGELTFYWITVVATISILLFEGFGGMRSVAYTDAVEGFVMILVFLIMPIIITAWYGGFVGQVVNKNDLPCNNANQDETSGCVNYDQGPFGVDQYYLRKPSSLTIANYMLFCMSVLSFPVNPHLIQRVYTAQHDWQLKLVVMCLFIAPFLTMLPGVLTGITAISNQGSGFGAFSEILSVFRDKGGFAGFISYVAMIGAVAGIISTTDSALIGVSNTISVDIFKNWLTPNLDNNKIVWIGKIISFITIWIAFGIASWLYQETPDFASMLTLQQAILWQAFPAYILGMYTNINYRSVLLGLVLGILCDVILISIVYSDEGANDPFAKSDPSLVALDKAWSSLVGVLLNIIGCGIGHWIIKWREDDEHNDELDEIGELNIDKIRDIMSNTEEPITKYYGVPVYFMGICYIIAVFHWIGETDSDLIDQFGEDTVKTFMYNGKIQNVIAGMPSWCFASVIWFVIGTLSGIYATFQWKVEDDTNESESKSPSSKGKHERVESNINDVEMVEDRTNATEQEAIITTEI